MGISAFLRSLFCQSNKTTVNIKEEATSDVASSFDLPYEISNQENIARYVFSPINVNTKNNTLKNNCLKPPTGYDEISVNRYDYTENSFLKKLGLEMQNPKKEFYGLAIFKAETITENNFELIYTPIAVTNKFHSDIKIGYFVEKDVELPSEINEKIRNILKKTKLFEDSDTTTSDWVGDEVKL